MPCGTEREGASEAFSSSFILRPHGGIYDPENSALGGNDFYFFPLTLRLYCESTPHASGTQHPSLPPLLGRWLLSPGLCPVPARLSCSWACCGFVLAGLGGNEAGVQMKVVILVQENEGVWNAQVFKCTGRCGYGAISMLVSTHPGNPPPADGASPLGPAGRLLARGVAQGRACCPFSWWALSYVSLIPVPGAWLPKLR